MSSRTPAQCKGCRNTRPTHQLQNQPYSLAHVYALAAFSLVVNSSGCPSSATITPEQQKK
ncbi:hypothetical protein SMJ63A_60195 [Stenotrophomonas geniculata]